MRAAPALEQTLLDLGAGREIRVRTMLLVVCTLGPLYGACMGSFALDSVERLRMVLYAAVKMPLLILTTSCLCLPAFFVVTTILGLREDFVRSLRAIVCGQGAVVATLASLGPITLFLYVSGIDHRWAILSNAAMFSAATLVGFVVTRRHYAELLRKHAAHRVMLWLWLALYSFVGIQMGWTLRPFIGTPDIAVTFFRDEPFTNAYVVVARLIAGAF